MVLGFMDGTTEESSHPDGRKGKDREQALDEVLTELVDEPVQSLTELRDNIRKDFRK